MLLVILCVVTMGSGRGVICGFKFILGQVIFSLLGKQTFLFFFSSEVSDTLAQLRTN